MRSVWARRGALFAALLAPAVLLPTDALGQDSTGRPSVTTPNPPPRTRTRRPTGRPKKVIRGREATDVEKVPTASVIIRSYPPGADVYLNGKNVGTTADDGELELSDVRLGQHRVVLKKDGYREWAQTVSLTQPGDVELEPLLQTESIQFYRESGRLPVLEMGREVTGQISRDGFAGRDGKSFFNEFVLRAEGAGAYLLTLRGRGVEPSVRIVDANDQPYGVEPIGQGVYQSVVLPRAGTYYLQVAAPIDESSFVAGDYTLTVVEESVARGESTIAVGETRDGALEPTDRTSGPMEYYDVWVFEGDAARVRIAAESAEFTPALTVLRDGRGVAATGQGKKKDDGGIRLDLQGGKYTVYVRSASGNKVGRYRISITPQ